MRLLPDVDALVLSILRDALPAVEILLALPADLVDRPRPVVVARRISGAAIDPVRLDRALVTMDCWAPARQVTAELAESCRVILHRAWHNQLVYPLGHLAGYREVSAPAELRAAGQTDRLSRFHATYELRVRPGTSH